MKRRKYSIETKNQVTKDKDENGLSTAEIAEKYSIPYKTVEKWVTIYNKDPTVYTNSEGETSLEKLQKENARLRRYNNILKKTLSKLAARDMSSTDR